MNRRFRVALSYAGEKRDFVAKVADALAIRFGKDQILYDRYHEAEFARSNLAVHLSRSYFEESDLVVAVLCNAYEVKHWCGLEWDAIYGLIKKRDVSRVMLSRFDRVEVKELFGNAGFVDLDGRSPDETAVLIFERLAVNEGRPKDHYTNGTPMPPRPEWPEVAPVLDWRRVADHTEARHAFTDLLTQSSQFRILPIYGNTDTGKTHLTNEFLGNAQGIPGVTCGRFDFKGATDMEREIHAFADQLDVSMPAQPGDVSGQLAQILTELRKAARPTLLIFDTFERAADADVWVKKNLLSTISRMPWLRVVVVGQTTVTAHGQPWARFSSPLINLRSPTPQEWFDYGQRNNPKASLDFVRQAHEFCDGQSSILAALLRPRD